MPQFASPRQIAFIATLRSQKGLEPLPFSIATSGLAASREIDRLMALPKPQTAPAAALTQGVYKVEDEIFVVKSNREHTRLYAKKLVEINGERLTDADTVVHIEFEYAPGAIYRILPEHKMSVEEGKALTIRYGRCICCGRKLKAAKSVEQGIGPVCITYFAA